MTKCQFKGLFYKCDEKYFPRYKFKEKKLFMAIWKDIYDEEIESSTNEDPYPFVKDIPRLIFQGGNPISLFTP